MEAEIEGFPALTWEEFRIDFLLFSVATDDLLCSVTWTAESKGPHAQNPWATPDFHGYAAMYDVGSPPCDYAVIQTSGDARLVSIARVDSHAGVKMVVPGNEVRVPAAFWD